MIHHAGEKESAPNSDARLYIALAQDKTIAKKNNKHICLVIRNQRIVAKCVIH